jgi:hypothetical protein
VLSTPCPACHSDATQVKILYHGDAHYELVRVCSHCDSDIPERRFWVPQTRTA